MNAEAFWPTWVSFVVLVGPLFMSLVLIVYSLYLSRHLQVMLESLTRCRYISGWATCLSNLGPFARVLLVGQISGMFLIPRLSVRAGAMDAADVEHFPIHLKRLLKINNAILGLTGVWGLVACAILELR